MTIKFTHVRLLVSDYKACYEFYKGIMGFDVVWGDENTGYADFHTGNVKIALFGRQAMAEAIGNANLPSDLKCQDKSSLIFEVASVDDTYRQLGDKGIVFITEPLDYPDWGIRAAHFRDPDGNLIEINSSLHSG